MKTALVCIAKDEDNYIDEWIKYHCKLGFTDIFIFQNDWKYTTTDVNIKCIDVFGQNMQLNSYNSFIDAEYMNYDWAAFFDVDEFLYLKKHKNVSDFFANYNEVNAIGINWRTFGDSNITELKINNYSVLERFIYCGKKLDANCKIILNLAKTKNTVKFIFNPHCVNTEIVDPNKEYKSNKIGCFYNTNDSEIAELNHYRNKTYRECYDKRFCKTIACTNGINISSYNDIDEFNKTFADYNKNDILNTYARDFYLN